jgi:hypothetical protein
MGDLDKLVGTKARNPVSRLTIFELLSEATAGESESIIRKVNSIDNLS